MEITTARSTCPVAQVLDLLGDRWSLLIVRDAVLFGKQRYSEFLAADEGISTNILANRLKLLEANGLLQKYPDPEDGKSSIYLPTEEGLALVPVIVEMMRWSVGTGRVPKGLDPPAFMVRLVKEGSDWFVAQRREAIDAERQRLAS